MNQKEKHLKVKHLGETNFMQVGQTTACGHCDPERFGDGLKQAEKMIPNYKCDCKCHSPQVEEFTKETCAYCDINIPLPKHNEKMFQWHLSGHGAKEPQTTESWEIDFDRELTHIFKYQFYGTTIERVKQFITNLLSKDREKYKEELVREIEKHDLTKGFNAQYSDQFHEARGFHEGMMDRRSL